MTDTAEEVESDPYEEFSQALDAARTAADKVFGKDKKDEKSEPTNLKDAGKLARLVFSERRKIAARK